ncbi:FAD-dependent oxidoreductase [Nonomuraea ceibae]|uniref:FAD-dependent oxidoreductase n=1 Tax=Nonomuraea ceibae TaxID=1935170 RepID=UPI001C601978|nr:FAD-dependent oxidoreductase [Nonomuraea ceibae]
MRVLICGAGIAGLALAVLLERDGHEVVVVERAPAPHGAGYMLDCQGPGFDAAESMGLLPELRARAFTLSELVYHDDEGAVTGRFADDRPGSDKILSLMRGELEDVLYRSLQTQVRFGRTVRSYADLGGGVAVTLSDGEVERADLLVGADGIHSQIRALAFGTAGHTFLDLGFHTAAYVFDDLETARVLGNDLHMLEAPGQQVGAYPARGGRVAALFTHRTAPGAPLPADPRAELHEVYGKRGWLVPKLLDNCPARPYYDRVAQIDMPSWSHGRVTLVGDACQAMSLLTGQGAGMALAAAHSLADALRLGGDLEAALAHYERSLKPVVTRVQAEGRAAAEEYIPAG